MKRTFRDVHAEVELQLHPRFGMVFVTIPGRTSRDPDLMLKLASARLKYAKTVTVNPDGEVRAL